MGTLFVIGRLLETETLLTTMEGLDARGEEVHVIFVQAGVENVSDAKLLRRMGFAKSLSCLNTDVEGVERVDYQGWVRLIEGCEKIVYWT